MNLELPLRAGDRLGGHIVQGHVDGTGRVESVARGGHLARRARDRGRRSSLRYVVEKGSIAVDGVSLTVVDVDDAGLRGVADPRDARAHDARLGRAGATREPGGGRAREVRGEAGDASECRRMTDTPFSTIEEAIEDIRAGKMVVVCDAEDRENEGDLTLAAQFATPEAINFMAKDGARPDLPRARRPSAATSSAST